ncbi:uncharacterized protein LOC143289523 [Babylonia areolata]|uniref:uncharacterized protein LOC143289523 n=1 Tax=Babylonia areolata TaxID=304850 RepID=UPI003FCFB878
MRPEVVLACLTLCLVEAGSSLKRRHLTTVLFGNSIRLAPQPQTSLIKDISDSTNHLTNGDVLPSSDQSTTMAFLRSLTTRSRDSPRDSLSIFRHKPLNRAQLLHNVLRKITHQQQQQQQQRRADDAPLTSLMTKRQMLTQVEKRRRRYRCDLSRVTIQMILSYFRTRTLCGFRVTRMRFGIGGK